MVPILRTLKNSGQPSIENWQIKYIVLNKEHSSDKKEFVKCYTKFKVLYIENVELYPRIP